MTNSRLTSELEKLIDRYDHLKRDVIPTEERLAAEVAKVRLQILDRARARTSYTGDPLKDLAIFKFGKDFRENYNQLVRLKEILNRAVGEFVLVHDLSYNLLINELNERDRCYVPTRVAALGIIDNNPLDVGYEHDIAGDKYYLKLRFRNGEYIRELEIEEQGKLDRWLNIIPTFRGREQSYTEKPEALLLVNSGQDYESSEEHVRHIYTEGEWESRPQPKKAYWRIAPDRFNAASVTIVNEPVIEILEKQDFPEKEKKVFSLYIGNDEVMKMLHINVIELETLQKIYDAMASARETSWSKSLIF